MTLAEKMEVAAEEAEGDEDLAAMNLKKPMLQASDPFEAQPQRCKGFAKSQQK